MFGHIGFSYIGMIYLIMLFIPNLLWIRHKPKGYDTTHESKALRRIERAGQFLVTCSALVFSDFNITAWSLWSCWLIVSAGLMVLYEIWWIRYFRSEKTLEDFYSGIIGIPFAGATLPVIAFLLLGIYGRVIWLIVSVVLLGIGHIGIHLQHKRRIPKTKK
ncbi:MAG: hypothetical protein PHW77_02320 [Eubacteriales bacterium]|nr:hypothetical protein [Eubacteriales bacterium]